MAGEPARRTRRIFSSRKIAALTASCGWDGGEAKQDKTRATLAEQATGWVKPLASLAGGIINGGTEADVDTIMMTR